MVSRDLKEYIDEYIETALTPLTYHVLENLPGKKTKSNTVILTSGGASVTVIPKVGNYVYQAYISLNIFRKINTFCRMIQRSSDPRKKYIVQGHAVDHGHGVIAFDKLHPLNEYGIMINKSFIRTHQVNISHNIRAALAYLHDLGVRHGDPRIDNVGVNMATGDFVLFDFDKINLTVTADGIEDDLQIFRDSLNAAVRR
jgi:hypothetical protein